MKIVWTEHALNCLIEIEEYIARDDLSFLIERTELLKAYPGAVTSTFKSV